MKKTFFLLFFFLCFQFSIQAQGVEVYFADYPTLTPDAQTIIFSNDGDLWQVAVSGGIANRITAMDGNESRPKISPDGKWLAFTGTQYGNPDIFIMPLKGGEVRQLTYHDAGDQLESWSWDSKELYFTSSRYNRMSTFTVGVDGGTPSRLFDHYFNFIHNAVEHPSSGEIYFNESWESSNMAHRKRYKGAFNPDIKSYNTKTKAFKQHTTYEGKDFGATIDKKGKLYFISDEFNGEYNLYTFEKGKKKRLTKFETSVNRPFVSANGEKIVFQKDYQLFVYDVKKGNAKKVKVYAVRNNTLSKTKDFNVSGKISSFDVSDDNKKLAFVSRGELFVSDVKGKFVKQLKTRPDGRVMEVYWLKDNKTLIFSQTVKGYQNWFTIAADGKGVEKQHTSDLANNRAIAFNSDKTKATYLSGREEVRLMDLKSFESQLLVKEELWARNSDLPYFAPDDKHIVFTAMHDFEADVMVYNLEDKTLKNLTQSIVTETSPFWSPDGKYIYFTSNRTKPSYPYGMQNPKVYRMPLEKYDTEYRSDKFDELFKEEKKDEKKDDKAKEDKAKEGEKKAEEKEDKKEDEKKKEDDKKKDKKPEINIDMDGLMQRLERISPAFGSQRGPYVYQKDKKTTVVFASNHAEGKPSLWKTTMEPFEKTKTEQIKGAPTFSLAIEEAKGKHYILIRGNIHTLNLAANKTEKITISHTFRRHLKEEFSQMFEETWANMEENFYNENFHGVDWTAMKERYAAYLPFVNTRQDLRRALNDMLGELNTSHFGFYSNGAEEKIFHGTRSIATGLVFDKENPYKVSRIVKNGPADKKGKDIKVGDILVKINGQSVQPEMNREFYFAKPSIDEEISLTFDRNGKMIDVKLHPTSSGAVRNMLHNEWMDDCQKRVDKKSNDRIAYIHMKNMGGGELQHFLEQMANEWHQKDALILDLRYNTGGNVHDAVLNTLAQRPYLNWKYREGKLSPQSHIGPSGKPIVLLINQQSLSDAEMTAAGFKELGLGSIIGTETYRWIIFTTGNGLVDGSFYRLPSWGCYTLDGDNLEMTGVAPDIEVDNTFKDRLQGKDPQLDRAISEVMKQLK